MTFDLKLLLGYQYIFERPEFEYQKLNSCLDVTVIEAGPTTTTSLESCKKNCSIDELCYGIQYNDSTASCYLLIGDLPPFSGSCPPDTTSFLQTKSNPYKEMEKTCLRNKIILQPSNSNNPVPIVDTESYECQALVGGCYLKRKISCIVPCSHTKKILCLFCLIFFTHKI